MRRSERTGWGRGVKVQGNDVEQMRKPPEQQGRLTCTKRPSLSACAFLGHSPSRIIAGAATTRSWSALIHFFSFVEKDDVTQSAAVIHVSPAK